MPLITFSAGQRLTAAQLQTIVTQVDSLTDPNWTDYSNSFALTAVTTDPTKGNSTYSARYRRPANCDLIHYEGKITIGSTFSPGSGIYRFSVPVNASALAIANTVGQGYIFDNGTANRQGTVKFEAAGFFNIYLHDSLSGFTNSGSGTAWATNDTISWSLVYEPA